jgi:hypothetical protein
MLSPFHALIYSLPLLASVSLPVGPVRRVSLFGYQLAGQVLDLEEAVARAEAMGRDPPVPAPGPANDGGSAPRPPANEVPAAERFVQLDEVDGFMPAGSNDVGQPCAPADLDAGDQADEIIPAEAQAAICVKCGGGKRYQTLGCTGCHGYHVKVFVEGCQVTHTSPPGTDEEQLGAVTALSLLHGELDDRQLKGAVELAFLLVPRSASPAVRAAAIAQWVHVRDGERFHRITMEGEPLEPFAARWKCLDGYLRQAGRVQEGVA